MNSSATKKKKPQTSLKNKSILLGVSGGVAAYKAIELCRRLRDEEASVSVVMTDASKNFVTPLSLEVASMHKVFSSLYEEPMAHITLPQQAELMVIAPATANIIGKFANGIADDLLSTCFLSFSGKTVIAPSMNWRMYENRIFRQNLEKLTSLGVIQVGPGQGSLACGEEGPGRMAEIPDIIDAVRTAFSKRDLEHEKIVVTAGPTREYLDPVRFISNRSSGKMGFAIAKAARNRGADVTLISGPTSLAAPAGMRFIQVETALEMAEAVEKEVRSGASALIMAAAVADFSPSEKSGTKIEKAGELLIRLRQTPDIISSVAAGKGKPFIIGFAAETGARVERAREKMKKKKMDMVVFNDVTEAGAGFDLDTNRVTIIDKKGETGLELMSKDSVAEAILDRFSEIKA
ncbi:MAG: bifunctional phosphopantothenoylcysteine decarboxylase/phosphopantothenate--cysteine ligase CoaBC [Nitrospirae bacterium]|nr:bifunctional phosphopantothenoylcysteine decarboxylase/phosphopantothenate--cysteine ligase CoaBC [Nitrospirota bacterium]